MKRGLTELMGTKNENEARMGTRQIDGRIIAISELAVVAMFSCGVPAGLLLSGLFLRPGQ